MTKRHDPIRRLPLLWQERESNGGVKGLRIARKYIVIGLTA